MLTISSQVLIDNQAFTNSALSSIMESSGCHTYLAFDTYLITEPQPLPSANQISRLRWRNPAASPFDWSGIERPVQTLAWELWLSERRGTYGPLCLSIENYIFAVISNVFATTLFAEFKDGSQRQHEASGKINSSLAASRRYSSPQKRKTSCKCDAICINVKG